MLQSRSLFVIVMIIPLFVSLLAPAEEACHQALELYQSNAQEFETLALKVRKDILAKGYSVIDLFEAIDFGVHEEIYQTIPDLMIGNALISRRMYYFRKDGRANNQRTWRVLPTDEIKRHNNYAKWFRDLLSLVVQRPLTPRGYSMFFGNWNIKANGQGLHTDFGLFSVSITYYSEKEIGTYYEMSEDTFNYSRPYQALIYLGEDSRRLEKEGYELDGRTIPLPTRHSSTLIDSKRYTSIYNYSAFPGSNAQ